MTELADWVPRAGDRVTLVEEADERPSGVVIDASAVDPAGAAVAAVDFPWAEKLIVVPHDRLRPADDGDEAGYPAVPPKMFEAMARMSELLPGVGVLPLAVAAQAAEDMTAPEGVESHRFEGREDRPCTVEGCGRPDRNPVHRWTPPYRMRYLDDLIRGDRVFLQDRAAWQEATIIDTREDAGHVWLIVVDSDGDQRGIAAHRFTTLPVPL